MPGQCRTPEAHHGEGSAVLSRLRFPASWATLDVQLVAPPGCCLDGGPEFWCGHRSGHRSGCPGRQMHLHGCDQCLCLFHCLLGIVQARHVGKGSHLPRRRDLERVQGAQRTEKTALAQVSAPVCLPVQAHVRELRGRRALLELSDSPVVRWIGKFLSEQGVAGAGGPGHRREGIRLR